MSLFTGNVRTIVAVDAEGRIDVRAPVGETSLQHEVEGPYGFGWHTLRTVRVDG